VDPAKAHVALADLTPAVEAPPSTGELPTLSERADRAVQRAAELRLDKRFTEATIELEKALRYDANHPAVLRALALTQWEAGDYERARKHLSALLETQPDDFAGHYLSGRLAARRFENVEAIRELRTALRCSVPPDAQVFEKLAQFHLGELLSTEGYFTAAADCYAAYLAGLKDLEASGPAAGERAELRRLGPEAAHTALARVAAALGDYRRAANELREADAGSQNSVEARLGLAKMLALAGDIPAALKETRAVLAADAAAVAVLKGIYDLEDEQNPKLAKLRDRVSALDRELLLARTQKPLGKAEYEALEQRRAEAQKDLDSTRAVARRLRRQDDGRLVEDLRSAIAAHPDTSAPLIQPYIDALKEKGQSSEAAAFLAERLTQHPEQTDLATQLFDLHYAAKAWTAAFDVLVASLHARPEFMPEARRLAGSLAYVPAAVEALLADENVAVVSKDAASAYLLAGVAAEAQQPQRAEELLVAAVAAKPDDNAARAALARHYIEQFEWQKAIEVAAPQGVALTPDSALEFELGRAYSGLDQTEDAATHYNAAIRLNRSNTDAMLELALLMRNDGDKAKQQLEALVKVDPNHQRARELLFGAYLAQGDHRAAAEQLAELRRMNASPTRTARCVAWLEYDRSSPDPARMRKTLEDAMAKSAPDAETLQMIAISHMAEKHHDQAIVALKQAVQLDPQLETAGDLLIEEYQNSLDFESALDLRRQLRKRHPSRVRWRRSEVELLLIVQRFDESVEFLKNTLADKSLSPQEKSYFRQELVKTYMITHADDSAIAELQAWRSEEPGNPALFYWLLTTLQKAQRHDAALELLRGWPDEMPEVFMLGRTETIWEKLRPSDLPEIEQLVLQSILKDPGNDELQVRLVEILRVQKRFDEALELARSNAAAAHAEAIYGFEIYRTLEAAGRIDDAIKQLSEMLGNDGATGANVERIDFQMELAQLLVRAGRFDKAQEKLNAWLDRAESKEEKVLYLRILTLAQQEAGRLEEAVETLNAAWKLEPDDIGTHNDLGYTLADLGRELDRAEELIRSAVAESPRNSAYLDSLGWVLYKQGKLENAKTWLTRGRYAGDGEDPVVCDHLADTLWRLGEKDEARKFWKQSVEFADQRLAETPKRDIDEQTRTAVLAKLAAIEAGEKPQVAAVVASN
jgi:tetratricopeptide (TPR) repeat protein